MLASELEKMLDNGPVILDGAMGTELQRRGVKTRLPLWSAIGLIENPGLVTDIHKDYIEAGAQIITTNTFRTQSHVMEKAGLEGRYDFYTKLACACAINARKEKGKAVLIAGSMSPLEDCYEPSLVPDEDTLYANHKQHSKALSEGGVDFIILETMNCIREAKIAAESAKKYGKDIAVSFVCNENGLLSGESLEEAIKEMEPFKPLLISVNCSSAKIIDGHIPKLIKFSSCKVGAYANGEGKPSNDYGWQFSPNMTIGEFTQYARKWIEAGIDLIGGCCGTNPDYIKEIQKIIAEN